MAKNTLFYAENALQKEIIRINNTYRIIEYLPPLDKCEKAVYTVKCPLGGQFETILTLNKTRECVEK